MDYVPVSRSMIIFNANVTTQVVEVFIIDDDIVEHSEIINLTLRSIDSAVILNPSISTITIEDMDSELLYIYHSTYASMSITHLHSPLQWLQLDSAEQLILCVKMQAVSVSRYLYKLETWTEMS